MSQSSARSITYKENVSKNNLHLVNTPPKKMAKAKFNKQEIQFFVVSTALIIFCLIGVVWSSSLVSNANKDLGVAQTKVDNINSKNSNLKQEINELSSHNRLQVIANKYGLSLSNQNIRNVSK